MSSTPAQPNILRECKRRSNNLWTLIRAIRHCDNFKFCKRDHRSAILTMLSSVIRAPDRDKLCKREQHSDNLITPTSVTWHEDMSNVCRSEQFSAILIMLVSVILLWQPERLIVCRRGHLSDNLIRPGGDGYNSQRDWSCVGEDIPLITQWGQCQLD
jgi:hypothetical protein